jgi:hypothetical protein
VTLGKTLLPLMEATLPRLACRMKRRARNSNSMGHPFHAARKRLRKEEQRLRKEEQREGARFVAPRHHGVSVACQLELVTVLLVLDERDVRQPLLRPQPAPHPYEMFLLAGARAHGDDAWGAAWQRARACPMGWKRLIAGAAGEPVRAAVCAHSHHCAAIRRAPQKTSSEAEHIANV